MSEKLIDIILFLEGALSNLRSVESVLKRSELLKPELEDLQNAIKIIDHLAKRFRAFEGVTR